MVNLEHDPLYALSFETTYVNVSSDDSASSVETSSSGIVPKKLKIECKRLGI